MNMLQGNVSIKKIFMILGTMVCCVVGMAIVINILFPNAMIQIVSTFEDMIYRGTGFKFDFNNDGKKGGDTTGMDYSDNKVGGTLDDEMGEGVEGWGE